MNINMETASISNNDTTIFDNNVITIIDELKNQRKCADIQKANKNF